MSKPQQFARRAPLPLQELLHLRRAARIAMALLALAVGAGGAPTAHAQAGGPPVGRIEGDDIAVRGEVQVVRENGATYTSLSSGAQVTVRSGSARIELARGGEIGICGPARFSLVRAGSSLTLALDYGRVRARVDAAEDLRIFTPMIQASSISTSGHLGDIRVGLEESGKMCVHPAGGALRLEPQFGGDNIVVPQGVEATLEDGRLASLAEGGEACGCDALSARRKSPGPETGLQASVALPPPSPSASPEPEKKTPAPPPAPSAPFEQPIWKVYMPPLSFDASAPNGDPAAARASAMPPPSAETALLFREVYAEPVIRLSGEVLPPPAKRSVAQKSAGDPAKPGVVPAEKKPSLAARIGNFFRRLFGGKPKPKESPPAPEDALL